MTPTTHTPTDSRPWQRLVDTLQRAAFACHARGGRADDVLEDQVIWLQHCLMLEDAADAIRAALPFALPVAVGGYYWIVFTSIRDYGNTFTGPGARKQLWVAAISTRSLAAADGAW